MLPDVPGGAEFAGNQRTLQTTAYFFYFFWLFCIEPCAADGVIEEPYEITYVISDVPRIWRTPIVHVDDLDVKRKSTALDNDVIVVKVAVIFVCSVDILDSGRECMEQVESRKYR